MDILTDKKLVIGSLLSVALVFTVFLVAGYINLPFYQADLVVITDTEPVPGSCLILEEQYCDTARFYTIDADGTKAAAFNVPSGTVIFMPFDGIFSNNSNIGTTFFTETRLDDLNSTYSVIIMAKQNVPPSEDPIESIGSSIFQGRIVTLTADEKDSDINDFNLVVYTKRGDLTALFGQF